MKRDQQPDRGSSPNDSPPAESVHGPTGPCTAAGKTNETMTVSASAYARALVSEGFWRLNVARMLGLEDPDDHTDGQLQGLLAERLGLVVDNETGRYIKATRISVTPDQLATVAEYVGGNPEHARGLGEVLLELSKEETDARRDQ